MSDFGRFEKKQKRFGYKKAINYINNAVFDIFAYYRAFEKRAGSTLNCGCSLLVF